MLASGYRHSNNIKAVKTGASLTTICFTRSLNSYHNLNRVTANPKMRRPFQITLISGVVLAASYYAIVNNSVYSDSDGSRASFSTSHGLNEPHKGGNQQFFPTSTATTSSMNSGGASRKYGKYDIPVFTDSQVDKILRKYEESYLVNRGKGVYRYDVCQLPSNNPIEDDRSEKFVQVPIQDVLNNNRRVDSDWHFWTVFDGHAGWHTSAYLREKLIDSVIAELNNVYKVSDKNLLLVPSNEVIDKAIKSAFVKLDDEIVNKNVQRLLESPDKNAAAGLLMPALSGSCALLSFYETHSKMMKVAVTGDSRALLGSFSEEKNTWTVEALSIDQTGSNPTEVAKLLSEHPNEPNVVRNGRVLGSLEPSRAFGDARYKWAKDIQMKVYNQFFGRQSPANLKTPPYVTAEPIITTHEINPSKHDFMVMASDGLYEMLSNEEIVGLVVKWMEGKKMIKPNRNLLSSVWQRSKSHQLPEVVDVTENAGKPKERYRRKEKMSGYLLDDENVSTHLIRNALSNGGSKDDVNLLVSIPSPLSRRYRDDLTVTVVFFDDSEEHIEHATGLIETNKPATFGGLDSQVDSKL